jgi:hypothetical protein
MAVNSTVVKAAEAARPAASAAKAVQLMVKVKAAVAEIYDQVESCRLLSLSFLSATPPRNEA